MTRHLCTLILALALFSSLSAMSQSISVYAKDGGRHDYQTKDIESIVFTDADPLPLTQPSNVEAVDLGLSVKWASCNLGATKETEPGAYLAWGETAEKSVYDWTTYFDADCTATDALICGSPQDAAYEAWGGPWRLPTLTEMQELCERCTWIWQTKNGAVGCLVTGPNGASIFLPAAGVKQGSDTYLPAAFGAYLTGTRDATNRYYARSLVFYKDASHWIDTHLRDYGQLLRPVRR